MGFTGLSLTGLGLTVLGFALSFLLLVPPVAAQVVEAAVVIDGMT